MEGRITRNYLPGDEDQIVPLLDKVFDPWPNYDINISRKDHWNWKYGENYLDQKIIAVTTENSKVIGCDHSVILKIKIQDNQFLCSLGGDACVHPDYRKQGIHSEHSALSQKMRKEVGVIFGHNITRNPITIGMFERSPKHNRFPIQLTQYVYIEDVDLHFANNPSTSFIKNTGLKIWQKTAKTIRKKREKLKIN